jgi:hypothetical protein
VKILDLVQGSEQWRQARVGVLTASCFDKVIQPKKLEPSKSAGPLLDRILAEISLGHPIDDGSSKFMERGTKMEKEGAAWYAFDRGVKLHTVGFVLRDDGRVGCSPDRLVEDDGLLEIKCPAAHTHMGYLRDPASLEAAYRCQVQGQLWVCVRDWSEVLSYNPAFEQVVVHVERDEAFIAALDSAVTKFLADMDAAIERLGVKPPVLEVDEDTPFT